MIDFLGNAGELLIIVGLFAIVFAFLFIPLDIFVGLGPSAPDLAMGAIMGGACMAMFGLLLVIPQAFRDSASERDQFMTQCLSEKKEYECVALWRAGERNTVVMPMPIVVPR